MYIKIIFCSLIVLISSSLFAGNAPTKQEPKVVSSPEKKVEPSKPAKNRQLTIEPKIDRSELGYKKFFSTYYPDTFKVRANGKEVYVIKDKKLLTDKPISIPVDNNKLTIEYDYEWDMITGKRTGTKQVEFNVDEKAKNLDLQFNSWKEDNRIIIPQAKQVGDEKKIK